MLSSLTSQDLALWDFGGLKCFVQMPMYMSWSRIEMSEGTGFLFINNFERCWTKQWNKKIDPMSLASKA